METVLVLLYHLVSYNYQIN